MRRLKATVDFLQYKKEEDKSRVYEEEKFILGLQKPNNWNVYVEGNLEIQFESEFEEYMLAVSEHTTEDIDRMSTFRFYALQEHLKKKHANN